MKTVQKKILKHCLTIGILISTFGLLFLVRCGTDNSIYAAKIKLIFKNRTDKNINYSDIFEIPSNAHIEHNITSEVGSLNINTCCEGILEGFHGDYYQVYLIIDDSLCVFFGKDVGPTTLSNFESRKISDRHFEYTYTFMEDELEGAVKCGE